MINKKILIVDDEPGTVSLLTELLENSGYQVFACDHAKKALVIFEKENIQVAFLDLNMPDISGFELCEKMRVLKDTEFLWICAITGYSSLLSCEEYEKADFDEHFFKPFDIPLILETTEDAFKKIMTLNSNKK